MSGTRKLGRRPGDPEVTRQTILDAARGLFSALGYDRTSIRAIAAEADVDPALVLHHFTSKQTLFAIAHSLPFNPAEVMAAASELPLGQRAELIARMFLSTLSAPGAPAVALMRAAATNEDAAAMLREFATEALQERADGLIGGPDAQLRAALIASHLLGILFVREIVGVEALKSADIEHLVRVVSPAIERHIDGASEN